MPTRDDEEKLFEALELIEGISAGYYKALYGWLDAGSGRHHEPCGSDAFLDSLTYRMNNRHLLLDAAKIVDRFYKRIKNKPKITGDELQDVIDYMKGQGKYRV